MFLKISQNSRENIRVGVSFSIKLRKRPRHWCFLQILRYFYEYLSTASKQLMYGQFTSVCVPGELTVLNKNGRLTTDLEHREIKTSLILYHPLFREWYVKLVEIIATFW